MFRTLSILILIAVCSLSAAESVRIIKDAKAFDAAIASLPGIVVVDFHAEWCGPCKQLGPILEEVANESGGTVTLLKVDVDKNPELAGRFSIESIPAVYLYKSGKQTAQKIGGMDKVTAKAFIAQ